MSATSALPKKQLPPNTFGIRHGEFYLYMRAENQESIVPVLTGISFNDGVIHVESGMILQDRCGFQITIGNRSFCLMTEQVEMIFEAGEKTALWTNPDKKIN